jgi:hypothetical protein
MRAIYRAARLILAAITLLGACKPPVTHAPETYSVAYRGNGHSSGAAPADPGEYEEGESVTVSDPGNLALSDHYFASWNTADDGSGTTRVPGTIFTMGSADVELFAQWHANHTVTYDPNGGFGDVPTDGDTYQAGDPVTALDNVNLVQADSVFAGWNTERDGSGANIREGSSFPMGTEDVVLYAKWISTVTPFISVWDTTATSDGSSDNDQVILPFTETGSYDCVVDWGDGSEVEWILAHDDTGVAHTYATADTYTIHVYGDVVGFRFANTGDRLKLSEIQAWGNLNLGNDGAYFHGASNLTITVAETDILDLTGTTDLSSAFEMCTVLDSVPGINAWDVSGVLDMSRLFADAREFDTGIGGWQVDLVQDMYRVFYYAESFDQDIGGWNVESVVDMEQMFMYAHDFDQDIGDWDVSQVTTMRFMFFGATSFDQDIGGWDISSVSDMTRILMNSGLSRDNYDNLLVGWATLSESVDLQSDVPFRVTAQFSATGASSRATLVDDWDWQITDLGLWTP